MLGDTKKNLLLAEKAEKVWNSNIRCVFRRLTMLAQVADAWGRAEFGEQVGR